MAKDKIFRRIWLNKDRGSAYIMVTASKRSHTYTNKRTSKTTEEQWIDADVELKDCNRQINLEFYCGCEKTKKQRIKKLEILIKELSDLKAFIEGQEVYEEREVAETKEDDTVNVIEATATLTAVDLEI
jgi:hypothetical protein